MNMNKALQNLYHAVSNETTTKVNISKLLVDIHYAITGKESANKNNWSKIINSMADNWPEGGGGSWTVLTEETVTTTEQGGYNAGQLSYSQFIDAETIRVTFDGVEYDCPRMVLESNQNFYGGFDTATMMPDFSAYPFAISSHSGSDSINDILAQTAGTHTFKIEVPA